MTTDGTNEASPSRSPRRLVRSRRDQVIGGVCGGIGRHLGVEPVLLRIAAVLLALMSGGTAVLAYVLAWVLIPQAGPGEEPASEEPGATSTAPPTQVPSPEQPVATTGRVTPGSEPAAPPPGEVATGGEPAPHGGARAAWNAVGGELRTLGRELRRPRDDSPAPDTGAGVRSRSPLDAADRAATSLGERLRDPGVQSTARRVAQRLSTAVNTSADELGRRSRREGGPQQENTEPEVGSGAEPGTPR
jgi:phage shock protein PspC (stress-responsive transcriptional regulator)